MSILTSRGLQLGFTDYLSFFNWLAWFDPWAPHDLDITHILALNKTQSQTKERIHNHYG